MVIFKLISMIFLTDWMLTFWHLVIYIWFTRKSKVHWQQFYYESCSVLWHRDSRRGVSEWRAGPTPTLVSRNALRVIHWPPTWNVHPGHKYFKYPALGEEPIGRHRPQNWNVRMLECWHSRNVVPYLGRLRHKMHLTLTSVFISMSSWLGGLIG